MKSLNTVIEVLEACQNDAIECFECPMRHETECEVKSVALAYLKEYQKIEDEYEELKDWWAEEHAENEPLSWDELKQMEGKPVWIDGSVCSSGFWAIVDGFGESGGADYVFLCGNQFWKEDMKDDDDGLSWRAYRKERK